MKMDWQLFAAAAAAAAAVAGTALSSATAAAVVGTSPSSVAEVKVASATAGHSPCPGSCWVHPCWMMSTIWSHRKLVAFRSQQTERKPTVPLPAAAWDAEIWKRWS